MTTTLWVSKKALEELHPANVLLAHPTPPDDRKFVSLVPASSLEALKEENEELSAEVELRIYERDHVMEENERLRDLAERSERAITVQVSVLQRIGVSVADATLVKLVQELRAALAKESGS